MGGVASGCERSVWVRGVRPARIERTEARSGVAFEDDILLRR